MLSQRTEQWKNIEQVSQQMRDLAVSVHMPARSLNSEDFAERTWQEINKLNLKRKQSLDSFFKTSVNKHEVDFLRQHIKKIMALDAELINIIEIVKHHLGCQFSEIDTQQRAAVAYHTVQSS